jgi:TonB family protein
MYASRFALLVSLGLLPVSLRAQHVANQPPVVSDKKPETAAHADSVAHYEQAKYPGGSAKMEQEVQRSVRYPAAALRANAEGRVVVSFIVEADGTVGEAHIVKSPSLLLNDEVVQAVKKLGAFAPARQYGQPVRSTVTMPVSFHIMASPRAKAPLPRGPVQPQVAALPGRRTVQKLVSWQDSSYWGSKDKPRIVVYRHYFTYDRLGRPATHTQEYKSSEQPLLTRVLRYEYGPDGRLAAKVSDTFKYVFEYGPGGEARSIVGYYRTGQQWVPYQQTQFREKTRQPDGSRVVAQEVSYRGKDGTMRRELDIDYLLTADSLVQQSTTFYRNRLAPVPPQVAVFTYDTKTNPCGNLLAERWPQFEAGLSSPHNVVRALAHGKPWKSMAYTYNEAGLPMQVVTRQANQVPYQTQIFTYAPIVVPAPLAAEEDGVVVYPNPAASTATVSIKAAQIGKGPATLRLFDVATGKLRQQTEHLVATTFSATLAVASLGKGSYIVEITSSSTVAKGRLLVE